MHDLPVNFWETLKPDSANFGNVTQIVACMHKLACRDLGVDCSYVARGETMEGLQADLTKHAKIVHSYTDEQLKDPKMVEAVKAAVKQE